MLREGFKGLPDDSMNVEEAPDFSFSRDELNAMSPEDFERLKSNLPQNPSHPSTATVPPITPTTTGTPDWSVGVWDPNATDQDRTDAAASMAQNAQQDLDARPPTDDVTAIGRKHRI